MTTIITAADAAQFLSLMPHLAGFRPVQSIALVPSDGPHTLGVVRVDLPPDDADVDGVAATLIGIVCRVRPADGFTVVVYTDRELAGSGPEDGAIAHDRLVRALLTRADACGLRVADALCVAADGWGSYLDRSCPPERHPLDELADPDALALLPDDLPAPLGDQSAGAELPPADLAARERVGRALASLGAAVTAISAATGSAGAAHGDLAGLDPQALAAACALDDIPALFEDALSWESARLRPFDASALIWCLARPGLRDVALVQWCTGIETGAAAFDAQLRWEHGEEYPASLGGMLWGEGDRPDPARLTAALELARHAAAVAPRSARPGDLAAAGWLCWA
ncbi:MAG: hypothetical protein QM602_04045, partial [Microbacterium sp.]